LEKAAQPVVLLITPPLTQLNTPYPATTVLKAFLQTTGVEVVQYDLGISLVNSVFTKEMLRRIFDEVLKMEIVDSSLIRILNLREEYISKVDFVIDFLHKPETVKASLIIQEDFLPQASRFKQDSDEEWAFGTMGTTDRAKRLATLFLLDLTDFIRQTICPYFDLVRYAEKLCASLPAFKPLSIALEKPLGLIDQLMLRLFDDLIEKVHPDLVGFTVPFPGNLFAALLCSAHARSTYKLPTVIGGGYPNTELRQLTDPLVFNYVDYITLDDGELPLLSIIKHITGQATTEDLVRCYFIENGMVRFSEGKSTDNIAFGKQPAPDFEGLNPESYLSLNELTNPMHRLWSDGFWNKITLAHGCYWAKCAFCDTSLDYIRRYDAAQASVIADRVESVMKQTGSTGFHFTDEAAPPALLKQLSLEIIKRGLKVSWWTNIRFEPSFTTGLCRLMARAGCIAVTGGLETASDRLLKLMNKGVSIAQAARTTSAFAESGIMVHAYLMYGFPTQTLQETIDSLEIVRQLFQSGFIQSAFWHKFALTAHSPVAKTPANYHIVPDNTQSGIFANNELFYTDKSSGNNPALSAGLNKAVYNYMHGTGFDKPVNRWFELRVPPASIPSTYIEQAALNVNQFPDYKHHSLIWIGGNVLFEHNKNKDKGMLIIFNCADTCQIQVPSAFGEWFKEHVDSFSVNTGKPLKFVDFTTICIELLGAEAIELVLKKWWKNLEKAGLVII
jgi:radical SAM superfamily enzyme YgiQ (UPF0313 family)